MRPATVALAACMVMAVMAGTSAASARSRKAVDPVSTGTLAQGKAVFVQWCAGCHGPLPGMGRFPPAGTFRLRQRYQDTKPATLEDRVDLTPDFIRTMVRQGMPIMPPLRKTEVTDAELDALIAYLTHRKRS